VLAPYWSLSEDKTKLIMDLATDPPLRFQFDADEVDDFISNSAAMRATMLPPPPLDADPDPGSMIQISREGRWYAAPLPPGQEGVALLVLVPGYRWLGLRLEPAVAKRLADAIHQCLGQPSQG
jgi:hypothetical protein